MPVMQIFGPQFERAAGKSALFELHVRLLADKIKALTQYAHVQKMDSILAPMFEHFKDQLKPDEVMQIEKAKILRNKVLHSDFRAASTRLEQPSGGVVNFKGLPASGTELLGHFRGIADGAITGTPVRDMSAKDVGIFGWFLEAGANGTFVETEKAFSAAIAILVRLTDNNDS